MIGALVSRPKLLVIGALILALTGLYWLYQDQVDKVVSVATKAGGYVERLETLEAQQRQMVTRQELNNQLRLQRESIQREQRRERERITDELEQLRSENAEVDRWMSQPVPRALRLRHDAHDRDHDPASVMPGADGRADVRGSAVEGSDERGTVGDGGGDGTGADLLQRGAMGRQGATAGQ